MKFINFHEQFGRKKLVQKDSDKKFGLIIATFFVILATIPLLKNQSIRPWALGVAFCFAFLAFIRASLLAPMSRAWHRLGELLQSITGPIFLSALFFFVFFPLGILLRISKKDLLRLKLNETCDTYWIKSEKTMTDFNEQF